MNRFESRTISSRVVRRSWEKLLELWERLSGARLTYHARPTRAEDIGIASERYPDLPPTAVVLQGPVIKEHDFTLETVRLYTRTFPDSRLILSTWAHEAGPYLELFRQQGVEIVTSNLPASPGYKNINCQLVSSHAGMVRASRLGAHYALKTRTDQRLYATNLMPMFLNLVTVFPLAEAGRQRQRIIGASPHTFRYRLYGLSDMLLFGHIEDMLRYWGAPLTNATARATPGFRTWREVSLDCVCEVYLATEFLKSVGFTPQWTLVDSWRAFAKHFCVVDGDSLDLYWPKYYLKKREFRYLTYRRQRSDRILTFQEWLSLYSGQRFRHDIPEWILDARSTDLPG